ncbi:MAG: glutamate 5-kinase [bacterium]|nr:glutamate 5-kinase [bacterium]
MSNMKNTDSRHKRSEIRQRWASAGRLVVKVGSNTLTGGGGKLDQDYIQTLAGFICSLRRRGCDVLLVTSGAIRVGQELMRMEDRPVTIPAKQAAAAVGQSELMHIYAQAFGKYDQTVAQILLTRGDMADRRRYLNTRNALTSLFAAGVLPIANENDTVAVEEIRFGDNDTLAALLAGLCQADLLLNLSDVDGMYTADPRRDPQARRIEVVEKLTPEIEKAAAGAGSKAGTGGMTTKLAAARICMNSGIAMVIAAGRDLDKLASLPEEDVFPGTVFLPRRSTLTGRKRWLAFSRHPKGRLEINDGAVKALAVGGGSLLPVGITSVNGEFVAGDLVGIIDSQGREVARGLSNYSSGEARIIAGRHCNEIEPLLGHDSYDEIVHRDNMVITGG